jgi:hypothetical protein
MSDQSQEDYLNTASLGKVCARGMKKLVTECSSIKTLAMAATVGLVYFGKMDSMAGMVGLLALVGAKEVDFTEVINIVKSRFVK